MSSAPVNSPLESLNFDPAPAPRSAGGLWPMGGNILSTPFTGPPFTIAPSRDQVEDAHKQNTQDALAQAGITQKTSSVEAASGAIGDYKMFMDLKDDMDRPIPNDVPANVRAAVQSYRKKRKAIEAWANAELPDNYTAERNSIYESMGVAPPAAPIATFEGMPESLRSGSQAAMIASYVMGRPMNAMLFGAAAVGEQERQLDRQHALDVEAWRNKQTVSQLRLHDLDTRFAQTMNAWLQTRAAELESINAEAKLGETAATGILKNYEQFGDTQTLVKQALNDIFKNGWRAGSGNMRAMASAYAESIRSQNPEAAAIIDSLAQKIKPSIGEQSKMWDAQLKQAGLVLKGKQIENQWYIQNQRINQAQQALGLRARTVAVQEDTLAFRKKAFAYTAAQKEEVFNEKVRMNNAAILKQTAKGFLDQANYWLKVGQSVTSVGPENRALAMGASAGYAAQYQDMAERFKQMAGVVENNAKALERGDRSNFNMEQLERVLQEGEVSDDDQSFGMAMPPQLSYPQPQQVDVLGILRQILGSGAGGSPTTPFR